MNQDNSLLLINMLFELGNKHGSGFEIVKDKETNLDLNHYMQIGKYKYYLISGMITQRDLHEAYAYFKAAVYIQQGHYDQLILEARNET